MLKNRIFFSFLNLNGGQCLRAVHSGKKDMKRFYNEANDRLFFFGED